MTVNSGGSSYIVLLFTNCGGRRSKDALIREDETGVSLQFYSDVMELGHKVENFRAPARPRRLTRISDTKQPVAGAP